MREDEQELYDIALGVSTSNAPAPPPSVPVSACEVPSTSSAPSETTVPIHIFRKLLLGARSQIQRLKEEKKVIEANLQSTIDSGGVVSCPNCTHQFKDRLHSMRPRAMRKMRARNCVEIEFNTLEDLETWLYLNQLETNNDGMPTVMDVKKVANYKEQSLKSVGSLLPELVEQEKERQEKEKKRSIIKLRKVVEKVEEPPSKKSPKAIRPVRKTEYDQDRRDRWSRSPEEHRRRGSREDPKRDVHKRRLSKAEEEEAREKKIAKKSISDRIKFPQASGIKKITTTSSGLKIEKNEEVSQRISSSSLTAPHGNKEMNTTGSVKPKDISLRVSTPPIVAKPSKPEKVDLSLRVSSPLTDKLNAKEVAPTAKPQAEERISPTVIPSKPQEPTKKPQEIPKKAREPIRWNDYAPRTSKREDQEPGLKIPEAKFEFKVRNVEKNVSTKSQVATPAPAPTPSEPPKPKYKFVPTSSKKIPEPTSEPAQEPVTTAVPRPLTIQASSTNLPNPKDPPDLKKEEIQWRLLPVKKSPAVLGHIRKRARERQVFARNWPKMDVSRGIATEPRDAALQSASYTAATTKSPKIQSSMDSLNFLGISEEGIAALKSLTKSNNTATVMTQKPLPSFQKSQNDIANSCQIPQQRELQKPIQADLNLQVLSPFDDTIGDPLGEFFPNLVYPKQGEATPTNTDSSSYRPLSAESLGSMADRDETELAPLVREDSAVPPSGDYDDLEHYDDYDQTIAHKEEVVEENWGDFCLEDIVDDEDEAVRDQKLAEMEAAGSVDEEMKWEDDLEEKEMEEDEEVEEVPESESVLLRMSTDFRLSDEDDEAMSTRATSTPRDVDDMSEPLTTARSTSILSEESIHDEAKEVKQEDDEEKEDDDDVFPTRKNDSFVEEELDWNYGTDMDEVSQDVKDPEDITIFENRGGVGGTDDAEPDVLNDRLEDGEISEDEVVEVEETEPPKKSIRERITFGGEEENKARAEDDGRRRDRRSDDRGGRHHRGSQENHRERGHKRDTRVSSYRSLLKRSNS